MEYTRLSKEVGRCLTKSIRSDYDTVIQRFAEFVRVSQFKRQPKHISEFDGNLIAEPELHNATILYGVEEDGSLTWLAELIDSSD